MEEGCIGYVVEGGWVCSIEYVVEGGCIGYVVEGGWICSGGRGAMGK